MHLLDLPGAASWQHRGEREGFEVAFFRPSSRGTRLVGETAAVEASAEWAVGYDVELDTRWDTRRVRARALTSAGERETLLQRHEDGRWSVDGVERPELDGCVDVDLESSAVTNTIPLHRLQLRAEAGTDAPAAFVRAEDLRVERLEQRYTLLGATDAGLTLHYESSTFGVALELHVDAAGLVLEYPGVAARVS